MRLEFGSSDPDFAGLSDVHSVPPHCGQVTGNGMAEKVCPVVEVCWKKGGPAPP